MVYTHSGVSLKNKNECYNIDEPWKQYAKFKKSVTKSHLSHDFIHMKCLK